jgi:hypothetical protein
MTKLEQIKSLLEPLRVPEGSDGMIVAATGLKRESCYRLYPKPNDDWSLSYHFRQFGGSRANSLNQSPESTLTALLSTILEAQTQVDAKRPARFRVGDRVRRHWEVYSRERDGHRTSICTVLGVAFGNYRLLQDLDARQVVACWGVEELSVVDQIGDLHRASP